MVVCASNVTHTYDLNHIYVVKILKSNFMLIINIRERGDSIQRPDFWIPLIRKNFFATTGLQWPESMSPCACPALAFVCLAL